MTTPSNEALQQHTWKLIDIDINGTTQTVPTESDVTLQFGEESRVAGKSGCNRYFASYSIDGSRFQFGQAGATRMMCPEPLMTLENAYFTAIEHVESYQLQDGQLLFFDGQGTMLLRFQPDERQHS